MEKENNCDIVQLFNVKLCYFLTRTSQTCALIRKHKENIHISGDFSFPIQFKYWFKYLQSSTGVTCSPNFGELYPKTILEYALNQAQVAGSNLVCDGAEWVIQNIIDNSKFWSLVISKCTLQLDRVLIYLDRKLTFKCVLQNVLSQKCMYGQSPKKQQKFVITSDSMQQEKHKMDLSELRVDLLRSTVIKLLEATGYEMADMAKNPEGQTIIYLHLSTKSSSDTGSGCQQVLCGVVINSRHHSKESTVTAQDYLRWRCRDMKTVAMHKYGDLVKHEPQWEDFLFQLGDAAVRIDLLHVKPSHTVCLNLGAEVDGNRETGSRGAAFILYNCARLAAILRQFEEKVQLGYYPQLIPYEEVDLTLLSKEEEWDLTFTYLLSFPSVLQSSVQNVESGKVAPHLVLSFIAAMCSCFSVYYRRVRILTEPRSQLLPVMFARLYLLQGIQQVLHNALSLLGIMPIVRM